MSRPGNSGSIRVMHIITRMNIGGATVHVVQLDAGLRAAGYACLLVTGREGASEGSMRDLAQARQVQLADIPELGREIAPLADLVALVLLERVDLSNTGQVARPHGERCSTRVGAGHGLARRRVAAGPPGLAPPWPAPREGIRLAEHEHRRWPRAIARSTSPGRHGERQWEPLS